MQPKVLPSCSACESEGKNLYLKAFWTNMEIFYSILAGLVTNLIVSEAPTMPNSLPSKLTLWMEYSSADLDNVCSSAFRRLSPDRLKAELQTRFRGYLR